MKRNMQTDESLCRVEEREKKKMKFTSPLEFLMFILSTFCMMSGEDITQLITTGSPEDLRRITYILVFKAMNQPHMMRTICDGLVELSNFFDYNRTVFRNVIKEAVNEQYSYTFSPSIVLGEKILRIASLIQELYSRSLIGDIIVSKMVENAGVHAEDLTEISLQALLLLIKVNFSEIFM